MQKEEGCFQQTVLRELYIHMQKNKAKNSS
jgi:hypothetical protein